MNYHMIEKKIYYLLLYVFILSSIIFNLLYINIGFLYLFKLIIFLFTLILVVIKFNKILILIKILTLMNIMGIIFQFISIYIKFILNQKNLYTSIDFLISILSFFISFYLFLESKKHLTKPYLQSFKHH